jgi:ComF family protein
VKALDDTIFPPHCLLTGAHLVEHDRCDLPLISRRVLDDCEPAPDPVELMLTVQRHIEADEVAMTSLMAIWAHSPTSPVSSMIHAIKYRGHRRLARALGRRLGAFLVLHDERWRSADAIVPVPVHRTRRRERGYNQAELIADGLASVLERPVWNVLERRRHTTSQTTLSEKQRLENVTGVFRVRTQAPSHNLEGSTLILVDDVLTTGATVNNCAWALLDAGARRVDVRTLCATA